MPEFPYGRMKLEALCLSPLNVNKVPYEPANEDGLPRAIGAALGKDEPVSINDSLSRPPKNQPEKWAVPGDVESRGELSRNALQGLLLLFPGLTPEMVAEKNFDMFKAALGERVEMMRAGKIAYDEVEWRKANTFTFSVDLLPLNQDMIHIEQRIQPAGPGHMLVPDDPEATKTQIDTYPCDRPVRVRLYPRSYPGTDEASYFYLLSIDPGGRVYWLAPSTILPNNDVYDGHGGQPIFFPQDADGERRYVRTSKLTGSTTVVMIVSAKPLGFQLGKLGPKYPPREITIQELEAIQSRLKTAGDWLAEKFIYFTEKDPSDVSASL